MIIRDLIDWIKQAKRIHTEVHEVARLIVDRGDAGQPIVQPGDLVPSYIPRVPYLAVRVRDGQGNQWRRAVGAERFARDAGTGQLDRSQEYDWVQEQRPSGGGPAEIAGHATDKVVLTHRPVTVLEIRQDVPE